MAIPSIALKPVGFIAGTLFSEIPIDGSGDFTVVRATTATRINEAGLIESMAANVPRLDYSAGGCPVLLTEPQRTNSLLQSNQFDTTWVKTLSTITSDEIAAPISGEMADSIIATATNGGHRVMQAPSTTGVGTFTMYIKQKELSRICVHFLGAGKAAGFDCSDNTTFAAVGIAAYPTRYNISDFGNGWSKVEMYDVGTTTRVDIYIANPTDGGNNAVWTGDGTSKIYFSAAQFEVGSYPTSYIPTTGSSVTRNADQVTDSGDVNDFNSLEGVLMAEISAENISTFRNISINDGTSSNRLLLYVYNSFVNVTFDVGSSNQSSVSYTLPDVSSINKVAFSYKLNEFKLFVNGLQIGSTDTSGIVPASGTFNELSFNNSSGGYFFGKTKQIQVFKSTLTSLEIETLTSWESFILMASAQQYTIY